MDSKNDYKVGGLYLVKKSHSVFQIEILAVTEKAYKNPLGKWQFIMG